MHVIIDCREKDIYSQCEMLIKLYNLEETITISSESLPLGDIIIKNSNNEEILIIERKKISDLASSINDGRYKEQSLRLQNVNLANHNIIYLIEGKLETYKPKWGRIDKTALYSSIVTMNYYKGFSVIRSDNVSESAEYIIRYANKIHKCDKISPFYVNDSSASPNTEGQAYTNVVKRIKKDNINTNNIHYIWLAQLPHVSNGVAEVIMGEYKTIWQLRDCLKENPQCLDTITLKTTTGKTRKIGKNIVETIKTHLLE